MRASMNVSQLILLLTLSFNIYAKETLLDKYEGNWWRIPYPEAFDKSVLKPQEFIAVEGNHFVTEKGKTFYFRGVTISDPYKLNRAGNWSFSLFEEAHKWGSNTIRLPIHPSSWAHYGAERYMALIDQAVIWANKLGMYVIIDWHSIGYLPNELFQHPMYETTINKTLKFWHAIALRYEGVPTTAVYEIFNEPTTQDETLGARNWKELKALNEKIIDIIYARDSRVIPLVAGFNWAYDLRPIRNHPIDRPGVAYTSHPYPQKEQPEEPTKENFFDAWEQAWGFVADTYPIIATEFGWATPDEPGAHIPVINDGSYGPMIIEYFRKKNVSWTVWCFDPEWPPTMIKDWNFTPSNQGAFFKKVMLEEAGRERQTAN
jgi:aryl-phospho-beta-D-glucosidase BglC (GH1 family)